MTRLEFIHSRPVPLPSQSTRFIIESLHNELTRFKTFCHCRLHASIIQKSKKPVSSVSAKSISSQAKNITQGTKSDGKPVQTTHLVFIRSRPIPLPSEVVRLLKMTRMEFICSRPVLLPSQSMRFIMESLRNELAWFKRFWHCPLHASIIQKSKKTVSSVSAKSISSQAKNNIWGTKSDGKPVQTSHLEFIHTGV